MSVLINTWRVKMYFPNSFVSVAYVGEPRSGQFEVLLNGICLH